MSTEKIKKELVWIRQFIHKQDDENVVIRDASGKDIASWIDRVDAAIATPPAAQPQRTWQGLTDEETIQVLGNVREKLDGNVFGSFAKGIEAKLKEKNT